VALIGKAVLLTGQMVALAAALNGCQRETPAPVTRATAPAPAMAAPAANVSAARLAADEPDEWLTSGRDANGTYYSPLKDIDTGNVARLGFAWDYDLGTHRGQESTPLVIDGVMYATSNFGRVYALDAVTGKELWTYDPHIDGQWARYACCDAVNRGLVAFDGRLFVGALDGWLHAIDARTGRTVWKVDTLIGRSEHKPYTLTAARILPGHAATSPPTTGKRARCVGAFSRCRVIPPTGPRTSPTSRPQ
jgi:glucose dehydrogenase